MTVLFYRRVCPIFRLTGRAYRRSGTHCSSCPEPLLIKDINVKVNKQKPSNACHAEVTIQYDCLKLLLIDIQSLYGSLLVLSLIQSALTKFFISICIVKLTPIVLGPFEYKNTS